METKNVFAGRSLCVIEDLTIEERKYLFSEVRILKQAMQENDLQTLENYRIDDKDFGVYEVFLEDSTRTKESFRNAANFHHVKVSELNSDSSSFNKGESYADTFNTLSGYSNTIFIIRSKIEGVCRWLEDECASYAQRNRLWRKPAFINAGDGKHEHPTQELLDEFTFMEDNDWKTDSIHLALVGDLYHGRTVHSKAAGLKLFDKVKVDLIAPVELAMPETYVLKMQENGYEIRLFSSIEEYLSQGDIADKWYFTRPQLERMGDRILQRQEELRSAITFRREFMGKLMEGTKFYHPLPRHKVTPTIPTFLDDTPLNGWERQSINGMYVRIILLALIGGKIGSCFVPKEIPVEESRAEYIFEVDLTQREPKDKVVSEGVQPIHNGLVIDHICRGDTPSEIRDHMRLISSVLGLDEAKGGEWVSRGHSDSNSYKGIIFRPDATELTRKKLKRLAAVAPGCTLNIIRDGKVEKKYRMEMPPRIYNFDDLSCTNDACISHPSQSEGVPAHFSRTKENLFACAYCGKTHSFKEIWKSRNK
ncbi:bifunctional aspartate carbamoyltransferase catalytic subunit/aspartate carbamoyltransferase regulatory subunit [Sphaerochaeta sp. PS]|uniref:bifunctional aspartate carbamoyltransferase catalytic subunit/aspartate carbamoyltransferase regulatory subunit n=1 Tax=Sphaerochaeta sp. PS TaxID=3076336 RepID=UPI0028A3EE59|nr:bifunctional aspartate carbamoyltransferase catalytic subunit/aspartate carbamoyltransferase regulatory subunit [Sphaerochaeta sp. PS]MDT4762339.1 bifunctional aspartate carbamoyltransferase catalytic subunit/aspartate carbamoyltransferase regulatory subunit [Sphaerochaeta sp. PS]